MSFHDLFVQNNQIQIPLFQREYVWTNRQWKRMVEELEIIVNGEDSNIIRVCKGVRLTALGFKWKYK